MRQPDVRARIAVLGGDAPLLRMEGVAAGYGRTEVLHDVDLRATPGQALCLIGPNGAGKSTVLNAIFGFANVRRGTITVGGDDISRMSAAAKLERARIGYVLQDSSVFQDLSVEDNLRLGAYLKRRSKDIRVALDRVFDRYPRLAGRRRLPARVLSGGERRLLEIARALMMEPRLLLIDEPSLGLDPRHIDLVFETLTDLKGRDGMAIVLVEQNVLRGLAFADVAYALVAGEVVMAGTGGELANDPAIGRLYLGAQ